MFSANIYNICTSFSASFSVGFFEVQVLICSSKSLLFIYSGIVRRKIQYGKKQLQKNRQFKREILQTVRSWSVLAQCLRVLRGLVLSPESQWVYFLLGVNYSKLNMPVQSLACLSFFVDSSKSRTSKEYNTALYIINQLKQKLTNK